MNMKRIISSLLLIFCLLGVVSCDNETTYPNEEQNDNVTISFNLDGGTMSIDRIVVKKGESIPSIETPVKDGYSFAGWYYDQELTNKFEYTDVINEDLTLYASYKNEIDFTEINSIEEFISMNASGNYKLCSDLDFQNQTIAIKFDQNNPFTGIFDGGNHTVKNFKTNGTYSGLFGYVEGTVKNLRVVTNVELEVNSTLYIGLVAGYLYSGNIENCYAEGLIRVKNNNEVLSTYCGGIVGRNELGVVSKSYSNVLISNTTIATSYSGAIAGYNGGGNSQDGVITTCYANEGSIYSTATGINGSAYSGGIVGFNFGLVDKCFTTNLDIQARTDHYYSFAAGVVADNNGGRVTNSFSSSKVLVISDSGDTFRGGVVGRNFRASLVEDSGTMENCYNYEGQEVVYRSKELIKNRHHNNTTAQVTLENLKDANWYKEVLGFDKLYLIKNNYFPSFTTSFKKVDISEYKPIEITSAAQLESIDVTKNYILKNDITINSNSFKAIGSYDTPFSGTFDGNDKTITFANLTSTNGIYNGLFGYLNGNVKNLNVKYTINSKSNQNTAIYVAPIAGYMVKGYIQDCNAIVDINCNAPSLIVGGLVAYNEDGTIVRSSSNGNIKVTAVNKSNYLGGLVGINNFGTIDQSFSKVNLDVKGTDSLVVGGLIADNNYVVSNSYANSNITVSLAGKNYIGGLIGINKDLAEVTSSLANVNYSLVEEEKELFLLGGLVGHNTAKIEKCCYLSNLDLYSAGHSVVFTNVIKLDSETIKTASELLSDKFYDDGYPHLLIEKEGN